MATKSGSSRNGRKVAVPRAAGSKPPETKAAAAEAGSVATAPSETPAVETPAVKVSPTKFPSEAATADRAEGRAAQRKPWPVRLYLGEIGYDFIGKRKIWYAVSAVLILICLASMIFRGFNLGVEFAGGERFRSPGAVNQLEDVTRAVEDTGAVVTSAQAVGDNQLVVITADLSEEQSGEVAAAIADAVEVDSADVTNTTTSASWGRDVTSKALQGLLVFLVLVLAFLVVRFQWKMAVGAMVALVHDLVITAGIYSLVGFEVTPASVIGLLTILGFSLYDTVVVFDKVDENAKGLVASQRRTYSESANLAINQVLMRSINTSIFALLPVLGLLYAGVFLIGEGTLQDLALVLFVGMLAGVYSSIFLAAPVLCDLKEREPEYQKLAKRLNARRADSASDEDVIDTRRSGRASVAPAAAAKADRRRRASVPETATGEPSDAAAEDDTLDLDDSGDDDTAVGTTGGG
ncbi:MAG: protein translocase subunit SecF, partial [Actinomycetota bacterium]|nr:protein translocase subunit SecF [Actinomycetota bacterium]